LPARFAESYHLNVTQQPNNDEKPAAKGGRFSLNRLSAAFAKLSGTAAATGAPDDIADALEEFDAPADAASQPALSPRMIVEGMLFVGNDDGQPLTSREMAAHIRDVSAREVESLIDELNTRYEQTDSAYRIVGEGDGFRLALAASFDGVRQRLSGRAREAKLTPTAIEVLSVVAYRQPIAADEVAQVRGNRSQALLSQLVRRGLLRLERPEQTPRRPVYHTTDRFNTLFRIASPADLPSSEDLDDQ